MKEGGEVQRRECCARAVGQAASVSEAHVRSSVVHIDSGVTPSVVTQSGQTWVGSLRLMPPAI